MKTLEELSANFDIDALTAQLESAIDSKDPIGYMQSNINWEIDNLQNSMKAESTEAESMLPTLKSASFTAGMTYESFNPFRRFMNWLRNNFNARNVRRILCAISAQIQKLIDEEAELKKILTVALAAVVAAVGMGAINPVILTLAVGYLATMILNGVGNFCGV